MKTKLVVITLFLAVLLVLTSCSLLKGGVTADDSCSVLEGAARDNCYFESLKCSKIKNTQFRDSCVAELAKTKNDLAVCDLIVTSKTRGFCQEQIALQQNDVSLCAEILDEYWQGLCYYHLAIKAEDYKTCANILEVNQNIDCVKKVAITTNNAELCDRLSKQNRAECLYKIATATLNADLFAQFADDQVNSGSCYLKIAKLTGNKELCNKITIKDMRQICNGYLEEKEAVTS